MLDLSIHRAELPWPRGPEGRDPRAPDLEAGADHAGACGSVCAPSPSDLVL